MTIPLRTASSPLEVLTLMEELYKDEKRWTRYRLARNWLSWEVLPESGFAHQFCLIGAARRFAKSDAILERTDEALCAVTETPIHSFNDSPSTTIDDIRRVIRAAKERL